MLPRLPLLAPRDGVGEPDARLGVGVALLLRDGVAVADALRWRVPFSASLTAWSCFATACLITSALKLCLVAVMLTWITALPLTQKWFSVCAWSESLPSDTSTSRPVEVPPLGALAL